MNFLNVRNTYGTLFIMGKLRFLIRTNLDLDEFSSGILYLSSLSLRGLSQLSKLVKYHSRINFIIYKLSKAIIVLQIITFFHDMTTISLLNLPSS